MTGPSAARLREATERLLPRSSRLFNPPAPGREALDAFARIETVCVADLRRTQSRMGWDDFTAGIHHGPLVDGYGDHPLVVRMRDGELLLYDGHHRTVLALTEGVVAIEVWMVDAADYAPDAAGRAPRPRDGRMSDDDLLAELTDEPAAPRP